MPRAIPRPPIVANFSRLLHLALLRLVQALLHLISSLFTSYPCSFSVVTTGPSSLGASSISSPGKLRKNHVRLPYRTDFLPREKNTRSGIRQLFLHLISSLFTSHLLLILRRDNSLGSSISSPGSLERIACIFFTEPIFIHEKNTRSNLRNSAFSLTPRHTLQSHLSLCAQLSPEYYSKCEQFVFPPRTKPQPSSRISSLSKRLFFYEKKHSI